MTDIFGRPVQLTRRWEDYQPEQEETMKATKTDLIKYLQKETDCTRAVATAYADCMVEWLADAIGKSESVELRGLGAFEVSEKPAHPCRFDKSKTVPAQRKVKFRPGRGLQTALKQAGEGEAVKYNEEKKQ
jgi:nucleoid DNA-binding protein